MRFCGFSNYHLKLKRINDFDEFAELFMRKNYKRLALVSVVSPSFMKDPDNAVLCNFRKEQLFSEETVAVKYDIYSYEEVNLDQREYYYTCNKNYTFTFSDVEDLEDLYYTYLPENKIKKLSQKDFSTIFKAAKELYQ